MRYSPLRHLDSIIWKRRPIQLTVFLTALCNANCGFCFYHTGRSEKREKVVELNLDELDSIARSAGNLLWLAFSGGEPFIRRDLADAAMIFYRHCRPTVILIPTNGLLTESVLAQTEKVVSRCRSSTVVVKLSLDGLHDDHDRLRGVRGAFDRFNETYRGLRMLARDYENLELGINTVLCSANQEQIPAVINYVKGLDGVKTHTVSMIRGNVAVPEMKAVSLELYDRIARILEELLKGGIAGAYGFRGARIKVAQDILQRRLILETLRRRERLIPCYAGRLTLVINEKGDVYPCESFEQSLGNLRNNELEIRRVLNSERARKVISEIKNGDCYCSHECYMMMNILFNPATYHGLYKEYRDIRRGCSHALPGGHREKPSLI